MVHPNEDHVVRRLEELLGWADYIVESLSMDQGYERGKVDRLRQVLGEPALAELRRAAWVLRERLDRARVESELRPGVEIS